MRQRPTMAAGRRLECAFFCKKKKKNLKKNEKKLISLASVVEFQLPRRDFVLKSWFVAFFLSWGNVFFCWPFFLKWKRRLKIIVLKMQSLGWSTVLVWSFFKEFLLFFFLEVGTFYGLLFLVKKVVGLKMMHLNRNSIKQSNRVRLLWSAVFVWFVPEFYSLVALLSEKVQREEEEDVTLS